MHLASKINVALEESMWVEYMNQTVSCDQIRRVLNTVAGQFDAKVKIIRDKKLIGKKHMLHVSGEYVYEKCKKPSTVFLHFSPKRKNIRLDIKKLNRITFLFSQTLQHELIHKDQDARRIENHKPIKIIHSHRLSDARKEDIEYYSDPLEVSTHAHDLALEAKQFYPNLSIRDVLNNIDNLRLLKVYSQYKETFRGLDWGVLRQSLLKKTWKWSPTVVPVTIFM